MGKKKPKFSHIHPPVWEWWWFEQYPPKDKVLSLLNEVEYEMLVVSNNSDAVERILVLSHIKWNLAFVYNVNREEFGVIRPNDGAVYPK